ncbi:MAG: hypothetical protein ACRD0U_06700 [Acidimicrobiales bacterium]
MTLILARVGDFAAISWNPEIRNILALLVGLGILVGSVYLLGGTNNGFRLGLLITLASLFGWMMIMGVIWWIYGIGMKGTDPHWEVRDIVHGELNQSAVEAARSLPLATELPNPEDVVATDDALAEEFAGKLPTLGDLIEFKPELREDLNLDEETGGWELLETSNAQRGDAATAADAALGADGTGDFETASDYKVLDVFSIGGKERRDPDANMIERVKHKLLSIWHWRHPTHYAVVQVQAVKEQAVEAGEAPPPPEVDPNQTVISVVMVRNLGDRRFPAAMVTLMFGALFALTCWRLHERDKLVARNRALAST